ncbi:MAG: hypothetical protein EAZ60_11940 [Oscillatoriales cyanobacterium]|nr:MAG: hypothetical protein EAZ69_22495 [Oscillatoriales cyanobacterium]TAF55796.1 MAG: hypothetical protein EAZ60_11940 [Oscillatoriales cyanobacterium]
MPRSPGKGRAGDRHFAGSRDGDRATGKGDRPVCQESSSQRKKTDTNRDRRLLRGLQATD